jgi:hypothetical protein
MAENFIDPTTQVESVGQLESVVVGMRAIAAARAEKGRSLLPSRAWTCCTRAVTAAGIEVDRRSLLPVDFAQCPRPAETRQTLTGLQR